MANTEYCTEQLLSPRSRHLVVIGAALVACAALTASATGAIEQKEQTPLEIPDFDPEEFMASAVLSNVVSYYPEEIGMIDATISCYGEWDEVTREYVPFAQSTSRGQSYVDRDRPEAWRLGSGEYDGLFHVRMGNPEQDGSWYWDNISIEINDNIVEIGFYDPSTSDDIPEKIVTYTLEPGEIVGGTHNKAEYALLYDDNREYTFALACNYDNTVGYVNRSVTTLEADIFAANPRQAWIPELPQ